MASESGSASFSARANFGNLRREARKVAAALRDIKRAREEASGSVDIDLDADKLKRDVQRATKEASKGAEVDVDADLGSFSREVELGVERATSKAEGSVDVHADTDDLVKETRRAVNEAEAAAGDIDVEATVDADGLVAETRAAVQEAESVAEDIDVAMSLGIAGFVAETRAAVREAEAAAGDIDVDMDVDPLTLVKDTRQSVAVAEASAGAIDIELDADGKDLRKKVTLWTKLAEVGQRIRVKVEPDTSGGGGKGIFGALSDVSKEFDKSKAGGALSFIVMAAIPFVVTGLQLVANSLASLGTAAVGAVSTLGPVLGILAAVPALATGAAGAIGGLILAFGGVMKALQAYSQKQSSSGKSAAAAARADTAAAKARKAALQQIQRAQERLGDVEEQVAENRVAAAKRVTDAEERLGDAYKRAADIREAALRRVQTSERNAQSATERSQRALENLVTTLRRAAEARRQLERQTKRNVISERRAEISILKAQERINQISADPTATQRDMEEALLDLQDAELDLLDIRDKKNKDQVDLQDLERRGIEGTQEVIDARREMRDAELAVLDARKESAEAQQGLADAEVEATRTIRDALLNLQDARDGMAKTERTNARLIRDAQRDLVNAYDSLADAAEAAGAAGADAMDPFADAMADLPKSAQDFVRFLIGMEPILKRLKTVASDNLFPGLTTGIKNLMGMLPQIESLIGRASKVVGDSIAEITSLASDPRFRANFDVVGDAGIASLRSLLLTMRPLLDMFYELGAAAAPVATWFTEWLRQLAESGSVFLRMKRDGGGLAKFFAETRFTVEAFFKAIGNLVAALSRLGAIAYEVMGKEMLTNLDAGMRKFNDFTKSVEGKNKIREYFEKAKPAVWEMGRLVRDVGKVLLGFGTNEHLADLIQKIREVLLPSLERLLTLGNTKLGSSLVDSLAAFIDLLTNVTKDGGPMSAFLDTITGIVKALNWMVENVPGFDKILYVLIAISGTVKAISFVSSITGLGSILGLLKKAEGAEGMSKLGGQVKKLGTWAKDSVVDLAKLAAEAGKTAARNIVNGVKLLAENIADIARKAATAAIELGKMAVQAAKSAAQATITGIKNLATFLADIARKAAVAAVEAAKLAVQMARVAATAIVNGIKALATGFKNLATAAVSGLRSIGAAMLANPWILVILAVIAAIALLIWKWDTVKEWLGKAWDWIADKAVKVWNGILDFFKKWWPLLLAIMTGPVGLLVLFIVRNWEKIKEKTAAIWDGIKDWLAKWWTTILAVLTGPIGLLVLFISRNWDAIKERTIAIWNTIREWITTAITTVANVIGSVLNTIHAVWSMIWGAISSTAANIWAGIRIGAAILADTLRNVIGGALEWIRDRWHRIWDGISSTFGGLWDHLRNIVRSGVNGIIDVLNALIRGANMILERLPGGFRISEISARFKEGGEVQGTVPGTGRGDKIPALLEPREFVHTRASVAREGVAAHHALNEGRATIVPIDRRQRYRKGGLVQRFARGGLVGSGLRWLGDRASGALDFGKDLLSAGIEPAWRTARRLAQAALERVPGRDKIPGATGFAAGVKLLEGIDAQVQRLVGALRDNEQAMAKVRSLENVPKFHSGGGVGFNPSKEVMALLRKGEGVASVQAMGQFDTVVSAAPALANVEPSGRPMTVVNIEINNPVGKPAEESLHRSMQKIAAHGIIPPIEDAV